MEVIRIKLSFVNAYLVKSGKKCFLIDTGLANSRPLLERQLKANDCSGIKMVVLTHGDPDHTGNCKALQEMGAKIALHEMDADLALGVITKRKVQHFPMRLTFLLMGFLRMFIPIQKFIPDIILHDGDNLSKYGLDAKILHIPGHTKGSVAIMTNDGKLFVGDTLTNRGKPGIANIVENEEDLKKSIRRLKSKKPKIIFPGHGEPFSGELLQTIG